MTSVINRFVSFRSDQTNQSGKCKASHEKKPLRPVDQKVATAAKAGLKGHQSEIYLHNIKDLGLRNKVKNERNIYWHLLNHDESTFRCTSKDISLAVHYCIQRVEAGEITSEEVKEMRTFFEKISKLGPDMFDRHALLGGKEALQRMLSTDLDKLLKEEEKDPSIRESTTHQLNLAIARAKVAALVGYGAESAKNGVNGTVIIKDLENHYVGVFKAPPDLKWYQVGEHLKKLVGQSRLLNKKDSYAQQFAEVAAHKFDSIMGFKLAPAATMAQINGKNGAFLAFLGGYKELKDLEGTLESRQTFSQHEKKIWQQMCLYNFLIANMDPHSQNIFAKTDKANKLLEFRVIDHGNSFIEYNPGKWGSSGNQGHWGKFNISKEPFEPEVLDFIQTQLTEDKLEKFINEIGGQRTEFWTQGMDNLQRERLALLRHCVATGEIKSPAELSKIHTHEDFTKHLSKIKKTERNHKIDDGFVIVDFD